MIFRLLSDFFRFDCLFCSSLHVWWLLTVKLEKVPINFEICQQECNLQYKTSTAKKINQHPCLVKKIIIRLNSSPLKKSTLNNKQDIKCFAFKDNFIAGQITLKECMYCGTVLIYFSRKNHLSFFLQLFRLSWYLFKKLNLNWDFWVWIFHNTAVTEWKLQNWSLHLNILKKNSCNRQNSVW